MQYYAAAVHLIQANQACCRQGLEEVRSLFAKFQRIQKHNTKVLELMAEMDRALGGEYIFDRAFLESSVRELSGHVYQVVYSLNAMSRNEYVALFDRYQSIKRVLDDILAGGLGPFGASLALPYSVLGVEMEPMAGALNVCLAEARNRLDIAAPDGFAVTVTGCSRLIEAIGAARAARLGAGGRAVESAKRISRRNWPRRSIIRSKPFLTDAEAPFL